MRNRLNKNIYGLQLSAIRVYANMARQTPGCLSLTLGEPDFDTDDSIKQVVTKSLAEGKTHYCPNNGTVQLRQAIAKFESEKNGMDYDENDIIVTAGATEGIYTALFGILNPGDEVIIPTPAFVLYEEVTKMCGGVPVLVDTKESGFDLDPAKIEALINEKTKAIVLNTPNNPSGMVYSKKALDGLHDVVARHDIFVLCDDVYRQLIYTEEYHSFMEYRDLREKLILIQSYSKPYAMTGWRMGYLCMDKCIKDRMDLVHQYLITSTPTPFQDACIEALKYEPVKERDIYRGRRDYCLKRLKEMGVEVFEPRGAFYLFPSIEQFNMSSDEFCRRMITEAKLAVVPGYCFGTEGHIRISYCTSDEVLKESMNRMAAFVEKLRSEA